MKEVLSCLFLCLSTRLKILKVINFTIYDKIDYRVYLMIRFRYQNLLIYLDFITVIIYIQIVNISKFSH